MAFHVGQLVTPKRGRQWHNDLGTTNAGPVFGVVYTIMAIRDYPGYGSGLIFSEFQHNPVVAGRPPAFDATEFRPVKTTSIEVFRQMLAPSPKRKTRQRA